MASSPYKISSLISNPFRLIFVNKCSLCPSPSYQQSIIDHIMINQYWLLKKQVNTQFHIFMPSTILKDLRWTYTGRVLISCWFLYSNFSNYKERFSMPGMRNFSSMFYSWDVGPVHFVAVNTEAYYFLNYGLTPLVNQYQWLRRDLAEANRPKNRSVIVANRITKES